MDILKALKYSPEIRRYVHKHTPVRGSICVSSRYDIQHHTQATLVDVEVQTLKLVLPQRLLGDAILSQTEELLLVSLATGLGANRSKRRVSRNLGGCAKKLTRNVSHL